MKRFVVPLVVLLALCEVQVGASQSVSIPEGNYKTFFKDADDDIVRIRAFELDSRPVTNAEFEVFVQARPEFAKGRVSKLFADSRYLSHWSSERLNESEKKEIGVRPVTFVSWFAAREYCNWKGRRLPTIEEWEYASDSSDPEVQKTIFEWYGKNQSSLPSPVGQSRPNRFGVQDMHGLIWEWVEDFNSVMISSDSRTKGSRTAGFFCGGGSVNAKDAAQYATFMRFAFRSGLKGPYTTQNLGFRCAQGGEK